MRQELKKSQVENETASAQLKEAGEKRKVAEKEKNALETQIATLKEELKRQIVIKTIHSHFWQFIYFYL